MIRESIFEQLQRIPEDLREIHQRLENWARWSRGRMRRGHCRSIEYRYLPEGVKSDEDREPRAEWDSLDAIEMHAVICGIPERYRWLLHLHVLHRAHEGYIRRALGIHRDALVGELRHAMRMCRNRAR